MKSLLFNHVSFVLKIALRISDDSEKYCNMVLRYIGNMPILKFLFLDFFHPQNFLLIGKEHYIMKLN